jgi:HlyD family secretion protein
MPRIRKRWVLLVLILAAGSWGTYRATRPEPVVVLIRAAENGTVEKTVSNTRAGTVTACRRARLSPGIGGIIASLPVKKGDAVVKGQLLMELWNQDLLAEMKAAENETASGEARARAICLRADIAEREAGRLSDLHKSGVASLEKLDRAHTEFKALKAECEAARASTLMNRSRLGLIRTHLERTRLFAPFDGIVAEINGELNEYVTPSPIGIATPPAVDLVDNTCFYVIAPIDEVDAPGIETGMPARITLDSFRDRLFEGRIRRIGAFVLDREKQARTVDVEVAFVAPEDTPGLLAGYSADVEIILSTRPDTLRIPTEAVMDGNRVFVLVSVDKETHRGIIRERKIVPGIANWDYTEVLSGLEPGDRVVMNADRAGAADGVPAVVKNEAK